MPWAHPGQRSCSGRLVSGAHVYIFPPAAFTLVIVPFKGEYLGEAGFLGRSRGPPPQKLQLERAEVQVKRGFRDALPLDHSFLRSQEAP